MLPLLVVLTLLLTAADHWSTYLCLRSPIAGWEVVEVNPLAEWLFANMGLVPGILVDSTLTLAAIAFLLTTRRVPPMAKGLFFGLVVAWTGLAVVNNFQALAAMGLSPLGGA